MARSKAVIRPEPKFYGSIAQRNRWTGQPHEHLRERKRNGWVMPTKTTKKKVK